jgi:hypothetical protein
MAGHLNELSASSALSEETRALIMKGVRQACGAGRLSAARQLIVTFAVARWCDPHMFEHALHGACESGNPELILWLMAEFKLTPVRTAHLLAAVESGQPEAVRVLLRSCSLDAVRGTQLTESLSEEQRLVRGIRPPPKFENEPLQRACAGGHLEIARMLVDAGLTEADARCLNDAPLEAACRGGHRAVIVWLLDRFRFTAADIRKHDAPAVRALAGGGHLEALRMVISRFELTRADICGADNRALRGACLNGHHEVAMYLIDNFALTRERVGLDTFLPRVLERGHTDLGLYLMCHFRCGHAEPAARAALQRRECASGAERPPGHAAAAGPRTGQN